jgi:hypothetical protein
MQPVVLLHVHSCCDPFIGWPIQACVQQSVSEWMPGCYEGTQVTQVPALLRYSHLVYISAVMLLETHASIRTSAAAVLVRCTISPSLRQLHSRPIIDIHATAYLSTPTMAASHFLDLPQEVLDMIIAHHVTDTLPEPQSDDGMLITISPDTPSPRPMFRWTIPLSIGFRGLGRSTQQSGLLHACRKLRLCYLDLLHSQLVLPITKQTVFPGSYLFQQQQPPATWRLLTSLPTGIRHVQLTSRPGIADLDQLRSMFPQLRHLSLRASNKEFCRVEGVRSLRFDDHKAFLADPVVQAVVRDAKKQFKGWLTVCGRLGWGEITLALEASYGQWLIREKVCRLKVIDCLIVKLEGCPGTDRERVGEIEAKIDVGRAFDEMAKRKRKHGSDLVDTGII